MRRGRTPRSRARLRYAVATAALAASLAATTPASAATIGPGCVGLHCAASNVPEAQAFARSLDRNDRLTSVAESGFYEVPALVYQGEKPARMVVYVSRRGELDRMPDSIRNLPAISALGRAMELNAVTLVVLDRGIIQIARDERAMTSRRARARAALTIECAPRFFCLWPRVNYGGQIRAWYGPTYYGRGWISWTSGWGSSQRNGRAGDTLLARGAAGTGIRYCAPQHSADKTFADDAIGNERAKSVALLGSTPDRC